MASPEKKSGLPLQVLVIEDSEDDTRLILRELKKGGYDPESERVETAEELRDALSRRQWDIIISDFSMPDFDGITGLKIMQESGFDLPFILVSGTITDEIAVRVMKAGAHDFIAKLNLSRLVPAIEREMREAEVRRARRQAEEDLRNYHAGLERLIQERTADLNATNEKLRQEIGEHEQAERALRESEVRFRTMADNIAPLAWMADENGSIFWYSQRWYEFTGTTPEEMQGSDWQKVYHPDHVRRVVNKMLGCFDTGERWEDTFPLRGRDGAYRWFLSRAIPVKNEQGKVVRWFGTNTDITGQRETEEALHKSKSFLEKIMQSVNNVIYVVDRDGRIVEVNDAVYEMTGYRAAELKGKSFSILFDAKTLPLINQQFVKVTVQGEAVSGYEAGIIRKDGARRFVIASAVPLNEKGEITGMVGAAQDITERRRMEQEIRHMAHHDPLTGLPNRRLLTDILRIELAQARRHKSKLAVLFLDLDRFKDINDTLGHEIGDLLLKEVAARFRKTIRGSDTVARIGGDEFNIVMPDIGRMDNIDEFAQKIIDSLRKPVMINGNELNITTSIGISVYPDDSDEIDILRKYADIAMYHAKESGRNTYQFYNPSINIRSVERMRLESMLLRSLELGELVVYYQPLINISTRRIECAEALVRWRHSEKGLLLPEHFIQTAEESGFINAIDEWVLRTVGKQARSWLDARLPLVCITVNLSSRQFQNPDLASKIGTILRETGMPPESLDIEISESMAMANVERSAARMRELSAMGIHISIDDFGTGYSSLNYLKRLPIERLKIDRSFIQDVTFDNDDRAIVSAVVQMGHMMKLKVVAEGVETNDQLAFLRELNCDEAQGFLFNRPLPPGEFTELLATSLAGGQENRT